MPYNLAIPPLDIKPREEMKTDAHGKSCIWGFIVTFFILALNSKYPSINQRRIDKRIVVYSYQYDELYTLVLQMNDLSKVDESQKHYAEQKETDTNEYTLHGSTYMKFEERQI